MSRVRQRDTDLERSVRSELHRAGYRFRKHVTTLPGRPDLVFPSHRIAIFIDGDFWHGYRLSTWKHKLQPFWLQKIEENRRRDVCNFRKLRRRGWTVLRLWGHDIERNLERCISRIQVLLDARPEVMGGR